MKPSIAFLLAFTLGALVALAPSCGTGTQCSAATCSGCCENGVCQPGDSASACGVHGGICYACSAAESCVAGTCQVGAGTCASTCLGCCAPNGTCLTPSNTATACGAGGAACQVCTGAQQCVSGQCEASACAGCIDGNGVCQAGTSSTSCGNGGVTCQACQSPATCSNQQCTNPTCTSGCTDGTGVCRSGTANAQCGTAGASCQACVSPSTCQNGQCVAPTCSGCTQAGACQPGTSNTACGLGGGACQSCTGSATCQNGVCVTASCNGCTQGGACQAGTSNSACGAGGVACLTCTGSTTCQAGICKGPGFDGGVPITCSSNDTFNTGNGGSCGSWRWSVKTGKDSAASAVIAQAPTPIDIKTLGSYPVPSGLGTSLPRTAQENTLYILKNVTVLETKLEGDADYHLPIKDPVTGATMEAEIPFPTCSSTSSPFYCFITHSRHTLEMVVTPTGSYTPINQTATIIGPALYDMLHGSANAAPNGIEIHPILAICFGQDCNPLAN